MSDAVPRGGFVPPIYPYFRLDALKQRAAPLLLEALSKSASMEAPLATLAAELAARRVDPGVAVGEFGGRPGHLL